MKRSILFIVFFLLAAGLAGCDKGKEAASHKGGHAEAGKPAGPQAAATQGGATQGGAKKADDMDMKNLTMESIQKEGKMQTVAPGTVQIPQDRQQLIGVRTGLVEVKSLERVIRAVGRVDYDERRVVTVSPKIGGWVKDLYVNFTGRYVRAGEPLLTIYSPELLSTQEEYLLALRARKDLARSPFPTVAASGDSLAESARRRLKLWDVSDDQIQALEDGAPPKKAVTLYSPYGGFVMEKAAYKGMNVMPGMALFKLVDLSTLWLNADIYEYELPFVRLDQQASIQLSYAGGQTFTARVVYIYPSLDPNTRTAKVRFEIPNPSGRLKPEMYANVEIKVVLGKKTVVPDGAVVNTGTRQMVIVNKGNGNYEPREIRVGAKVDDYYEVIQGVKAGERVVTTANFLIDSESKLKEALSGAGGAHAGHGK